MALNVEHMVAILTDFRATQDWFYSFRWIPTRYFRNKLIKDTGQVKDEAVYMAHGKLNPTNALEMEHLSPKEYRAEYAKIISETLKERPEGWSARSKFRDEMMAKYRKYAIRNELDVDNYKFDRELKGTEVKDFY